MFSRWVAIAAVLALLWPAATARAGNDEWVLFGNQAALMGGAVAATVADGSAVWYNPAGLAAIDRNQLDLTATAFTYRVWSLPSVLSVPSGTTANADFVEAITVPSALTYTRELGSGVHAAFGLFVPEASNFGVRPRLRATSGTRSADYVLDIVDFQRTFHGSIAIGWHASDTLRLGASVWLENGSRFYSQTFWASFADGDRYDAVSGQTTLFSVDTVAIGAGLGVQWSPDPHWHVGFSVLSPSLDLAALVRSGEVSSSTDLRGATPTIDFMTTDNSGLRIAASITRPLVLRAGVAYRTDAYTVELDVDLRTPNLFEEDVYRDWNGNVRIGAMGRVNRQLSIGGGLFTDRDPTRSVEFFRSTRIDYYGGTFGGEFDSVVPLGPGQGADTLVFTLCLALRYAVGVGRVGGAELSVQPLVDARTVPTDAVVNEVGLHVGSTVRF